MKAKSIGAVLVLALFSGLVGPVRAADTTSFFVEDTDYQLNSQTLTVKAGSAYTTLSTDETSITVSIPDGEAIEVVTPGLYPSAVENDSGVAANCNVIGTRDNQLLVYGPRTVTFRPLAEKCTVDSSLYFVNSTPQLTFTAPSAGERLEPGSSYTIFWSNLAGNSPSAFRLRLSVDGGITFETVLSDQEINNGFYVWDVPADLTTADARLKLDGISSGHVVALAVSGEFAIGDAVVEEPSGSEEPAEPVEVSYDYDPTAATVAASTISIDHNLPVSALSGGCVPNTRFKAASNPTVYYCGVDGNRYVFPNLATHNTWYNGFNGVVELTDEQVALVPLAGNVTYRPGVRLVKIQTDPKVYAVGAGGTLHWVETEAMAEALYGANWNQLIDDVPDAFFVNYTVGDPVAVAE